jgi:hypothetical protein
MLVFSIHEIMGKRKVPQKRYLYFDGKIKKGQAKPIPLMSNYDVELLPRITLF